MSHIVKGTIETAYTDRDVLVRSMSHFGNVFQNAPLYRVGAGYTSEKYDLVLVDKTQDHFRLGFNFKGGLFQPYQEGYGSVGEWTRKVNQGIRDRYIAHTYERQLIEEGYNVTIKQLTDGSLEVEAEEASY